MKKMILWTVLVGLLWSGCQSLEENSQSPTKQEAAQQKSAQSAKKRAEKRIAQQKRIARQRAAQKRAAQKRAAQQRAAQQRAAQQRAAQQRATASASRMLAALPVRTERESGYDRDAFEHWSDLDDNGCDTREDILRTENLRPQGTNCWDDRGVWVSAYDGARTRDAGSFDVDHMVPLAEAWGSGAWSWNDTKRELYANDRWPLSLRAVSATSNRSKSDQDPAEWMPPARGFQCRYALEWIAVKYRWRLSVDPVERVALRDIISDCQGLQLAKLPPRA